MRPRDGRHPLPIRPRPTASPPPPPVEPAARRGWIDPGGAHRTSPPPPRGVPPPVQEHIRQHIPYLPRSSEHARVVGVRQHPTAPPKHAVHGAREPRADRLHPPPQRLRTLRLDDQMHMIALNRVVRDPKPPPVTRPRERPLHLPDQTHAPQRRHATPDLERHVAGVARRERHPTTMSNPGIRPRLPSGTRSTATPAWGCLK